MKIPRIFVVDTNILVAGLISGQPDSPTTHVVDAMLDGRLIYLLSPELLKEYRLVLLRPRLMRLHGLSEEEIDQLLTEITANAIWREGLPELDEHAPDPGDEHLWKLLATEPSAALITGDRLLLEQPPSHSSVLSPASYVGFFLY